MKIKTGINFQSNMNEIICMTKQISINNSNNYFITSQLYFDRYLGHTREHNKCFYNILKTAMENIFSY